MLPYFIQGVFGVLARACADPSSRKKATTLFVGRSFPGGGDGGPGGLLLAAAWLNRGGWTGRVADANVFAAAACVDVGLALSALTLAGVGVLQHLDVAPKHAGLVFATGNTCATIAGLVAVPVSGLILERTNQNWSVVFGVIAAVFVLGAAVWCAWVGDEPVAADDVVGRLRMTRRHLLCV